MRALSLHPIYADEVCSGDKKIEHRTWRTEYRGNLLICASLHNDGASFVRGHAVCIVNLYDTKK